MGFFDREQQRSAATEVGFLQQNSDTLRFAQYNKTLNDFYNINVSVKSKFICKFAQFYVVFKVQSEYNSLRRLLL